VVLIDRRMADLFAARPALAGSVRRWLARGGFAVIRVVDDPTYGRMEILARSP
jgi:hypothetical protein